MNNEIATRNKKPLGKRVMIVLAHALLAVLAFIWLIPIFWVIMTSFRGTQGSYSSTFFPTVYSLDNYVKLFTDFSVFNFPQMLLNTLLVAVVSCLISTFFVVSVAYTLSRLRFPARKPLMSTAMVIKLFPGFMSMIAVYYIIKMLGWTDGPMLRVAMICVYAGGAGVDYHIAKGFFDTVPIALDEAARIDGANHFTCFVAIMLPLIKTAIAAQVIFWFVGIWNDYFAPSLYLTSRDKMTLQVLLGQLNAGTSGKYLPMALAGAVLSSIPMLIIYISCQKFFIESLAISGVKG